MNLKFRLVLFCLAGVLLGRQAMAQGTFTLTNNVSGQPVVFTNLVGTLSTNGTLIVFEGQVDSAISVPKDLNTTSGSYLSSLQLLTQVRLFDELPASNEVGSVQGAIAALRNSVGSSIGTYYVWAVTNGGLVGWTTLQTTNVPSTTFSVTDGATNYVTFLFSYPASGGAITYQVYVADESDTNNTPSLAVTSPTAEANGINAVSLLGIGVLSAVGSKSGDTVPLSAAVDLSVYASTDGIRIEIFTTNESGNGAITVYALINGVWTVVGVIPADKVKGYGSNRYVLYATGLGIGQSYVFKIVDEANHTHVSSMPIEVKTIKMEAVSLTLENIRVSFNTEYGRKYQVKVSGDLALPLSQWSVEEVSVYDAATDSWSGYTADPFMAGPGVQTVIQIPKSQNKAFFKVIMVDEEQ